MKPRRLGRGLDFLLQAPTEETAPEAAPVEAAGREVSLDEISPNPWQPRTEFDEAGLAELTDSIRSNGVLQPLLVRPKAGGGLELVAGERRMIAARRAGLTKVPVTVRAIPDSQMLVVALIENIQRRDLNPVERSRGFRRLIDEHGLSHEQVAELAGMGRSTVSNSLRILELDEGQLAALASGAITEGHARALLAETDLTRRGELFKAIVEQRWNVRATELAAAKRPAAQKPASVASADSARLAAVLREKLGTAVAIQERGQRGRIVIDYRNLAEFERLFERLTGAPPDAE